MADQKSTLTAADMPGAVTVDLTTAIPVFDDTVKAISFRKPTGADIISLGNPVEFDAFSDPPKVTHDWSRMSAMMARLSGAPASSFRHMDPNDLVTCAWALSPFFIPMPGRG